MPQCMPVRRLILRNVTANPELVVGIATWQWISVVVYSVDTMRVPTANKRDHLTFGNTERLVRMKG